MSARRVLHIADTPNAVDAAFAESGPDDVVATDNPMLAHAMRARSVVDIDALTPQTAANALGELALELADATDHALRGAGARDVCGVPASEIRLAGTSTRLYASLLHRADGARRALQHFEPAAIRLWIADAPRFEPNLPFLAPRFGAPARALGEVGFFGARQVGVEIIAIEPPKAVNDTKVDDAVMRAMLLPARVILDEVRSKLSRSPGSTSATLHVAGDNEAIREALPYLRASGAVIRRLAPLIKPSAGAPHGFDAPAAIDPAIAAAIAPLVEATLAERSAFPPEMRTAIVQVVLRHLTAGFEKLAQHRAETLPRVAEIVERSVGAPVLLTNGLFGAYGAVAHGVLKAAGVRVVDAEHGVTTGLSALSEAKIDYSEASVSDVVLCSSERAAASFARCAAPNAATPKVIGLADQTRSLLRPRFQRMKARRRLGLKSAERAIMHVSTLPYFGNMRPGYHSPTEHTVCDLDRSLIEDVYGRSDATVLFKQYPTQRFPFEPSYADLFKAPRNLRIIKDEDFRYIRAAADMVITMTPTSTLGWCLGLGRPLIWLQTRAFNPLVDAALDAEFAAAFLVVDVDAEDWRDRLAALLCAPNAEIVEMWRSKSAARERFLREAIVGPPGSVGRRAAEIVRAELKIAAAACNPQEALA